MSRLRYWLPAIAFVGWVFVLTPVVVALWAMHLANPRDDVDWMPLWWPVVGSVVWVAALAATLAGLRGTRRVHA